MTDEVKLQRVEGHSETRFLGSDVFESSGRALPPSRRGGTVTEKAREIDVYHSADVDQHLRHGDEVHDQCSRPRGRATQNPTHQ